MDLRELISTEKKDLTLAVRDSFSEYRKALTEGNALNRIGYAVAIPLMLPILIPAVYILKKIQKLERLEV